MSEEIFGESKSSISTECKCPTFILSESTIISERKKKILSIEARTEDYLVKRRIPELIQFLFTKILVETPDKPDVFLEKLLDDCMHFRAGIGPPPVLYEDRHLEAVLKSFDPGQRGWLSEGQVRRLYTTLDLTPDQDIGKQSPCDMVLESVKGAQELELYELLVSGTLDKSISE